MKQCSICRRVLPGYEFYLVRSDMRTLRSYCKECSKRRQRERRHA